MPRRMRRRAPAVLLIAGGTLSVGVVVALLEPLRYNCAATFRVEGDNLTMQVAEYRRRLLDFAWKITPAAEDGSATEEWSVYSPSDSMLRLGLISAKPVKGLERVREVARAFLDDVAKTVAARRATPSHAEVVLSEYTSELEARLNSAQSTLEQASGAIPDDNPREERDVLLRSWKNYRRNFIEARERLASSTAELERLRLEPEPTHGAVPANERAAALKADLALQQDLQELAVNLSELRTQLLSGSEASASDLHRLALAADELVDAIEGNPDLWNAAGRGATQESMLLSAERYREFLMGISTGWDSEFAKLGQLEVDPLSSEILDVQRRLRALVGDFLFAASKQLAVLRAGVVSLGSGSQDRARLHVMESDVTRAFQTLQTAHRRFEFGAAAIDPHDNFRLDTALRSSHGLRRRSRKRIEAIDKSLQQQAARRARRGQVEATRAAERDVTEAREEVGKAVDKLVGLQEDLNLNVDLSEEYLRSALEATLAERSLKAARADVIKATDRLHDIADQRLADIESSSIELEGCGIIGGALNLGRRLRQAGVAAAMTLLILTFGFRWLSK